MVPCSTEAEITRQASTLLPPRALDFTKDLLSNISRRDDMRGRATSAGSTAESAECPERGLCLNAGVQRKCHMRQVLQGYVTL